MAAVNGLNLNPEVHHHHHHMLPYNPNRGLHPRYQPTDLSKLGSSSPDAPQYQLNYHRYGQDDLVHILPKGIYTDKDNDFCIYLDVGLFTPEELTVKIVNDHLVIEGLHKEREAHDMGFVERHFRRRYDLPKGYNPDAMVSKLSSDGTLNVVLPKNITTPGERILPIQHTGPSEFFLKYEFGNEDMNKSKNENVKKENAVKTKNPNEKVEFKDEKEKKLNQK